MAAREAIDRDAIFTDKEQVEHYVRLAERSAARGWMRSAVSWYTLASQCEVCEKAATVLLGKAADCKAAIG